MALLKLENIGKIYDSNDILTIGIRGVNLAFDYNEFVIMLFMPTVRQEIAYNAKTPEYAEEIIDLFGLTTIAERHPQSLSEGQKRRVSIAAVAASDPEVLLLDEPTVGQDYAGLKEMVRILNELHERKGNTMITVTHDIRCAEALCDSTAIIKDGVVFQVGGKELVKEFFIKD
ncbi:MAG: ATP-binding cassette domain-containing protein [Clostridia bacterium]|nr:ATP-binding cassette domain-containing protein [Clostridia bacterium]